MQQMVDSSLEGFENQGHDFLVEIKNIAKKIISLILIDEKILAMLDLLIIHAGEPVKSIFTLEEIKN